MNTDAFTDTSTSTCCCTYTSINVDNEDASANACWRIRVCACKLILSVRGNRKRYLALVADNADAADGKTGY